MNRVLSAALGFLSRLNIIESMMSLIQVKILCNLPGVSGNSCEVIEKAMMSRKTDDFGS